MMDDILQQDIFFFVTTVVVVLVGLLLGAFLIYLILIARKINRIAAMVRAETDIIVQEVGELRRNLRRDGVKLKHFLKFFTNVKPKK